jgi:hypothetical protein
MKMSILVGRVPKADGSGQLNLLGTSIFDCFCTIDRQAVPKTRTVGQRTGFCVRADYLGSSFKCNNQRP